MATHRMTAARKAALRKAQMASARKRKGRGRGRVKSYTRAVGRETRRKQAYAQKHYKGAGALYKMNSDRRNSRGAYTRGHTGKTYGKKLKRVNKAAQTFTNASGVNPLILGGSYVRGRRHGTIKKAVHGTKTRTMVKKRGH